MHLDLNTIIELACGLKVYEFLAVTGMRFSVHTEFRLIMLRNDFVINHNFYCQNDSIR